MRKAIITASLTCCLASVSLAQDRFASIIDRAAESTVTSGGFIVNQKRVAIQAEIAKRPPSSAELGVKVPQDSKLRTEQTARQIAQYHPAWRVYDFSVFMPRSAFIQHFERQGLSLDPSANVLRFPGSEDFIDGLVGEQISSFRVWRKP